MVIDFHTHIFTVSIMGEGFLKGSEGILEGLDFVGVGPTREAWDGMLKELGSADLDQMGAVYLQTKSEAGIDKSVVFHVDIAGLQADMNYVEANRWFAKFAQDHSDRVIAFAGIDPHRGKEGLKVFEKSVKEWGMKGLKLHPLACEFFPNDKQFYPYYAKAMGLGVPVLFHTGPVGHMKMNYSNPVFIDEVAADFPELKIILAHIADPWIKESISIVTRRANTYLDISGGQILFRTEPDRFYRTLKLLLRSPARKRVLFATDTLGTANSFFVSDAEWVRVVKGLASSRYSADIPVDQNDVDNLMAGNAKRLLGLI
ncbi:MAG: amidohydrolase family protein [Thermodesulfobacteriota bacterium]|jgi:predicted TIM-barrel fold metal-dependent hydrolase